MATQIRPNRLEVSDRFPMLGFTVRTDGSAKRFEIAIGTSPDLFGPEGREKRNRSTFYSTRAAGPLPIERGEAVYVLPSEVLARFVGQQKLYYGLATFTNGIGSAEVVSAPRAGSPYINIGGLTGRSLQRVWLLPNRQRAASGYGRNGSEMEWAGDAAAPGTQPAAPAAGKADSPKPSAAAAPLAPIHYDDGYGPLPPTPAVVPKSPQPQAKSLGDDIPLDPGIGGQSIGVQALQVADIILSTTDHLTSTVIRAGTGSQVSHAMLFVGQGGQVIEAVGGGVRLIPLEDAIKDATVAVAFRVPELSDDQRQQVADSVAAYIGRLYDYVGVVRQGIFQIHKKVCGVLPASARQNCENWYGRVDLGRGSDTDFYCSGLVIKAFADAGVSITSEPPNWSSPQDIAELALKSGALHYVGHLKAPVPSKSLLDVFGLSAGASAFSDGRKDEAIPHYRKYKKIARAQGVLDWASARLANVIREKFKSALKKPYSFPKIRILDADELQTLQTALGRGAIAGAMTSIRSVLSKGYSVAIGLSGGAGAGIGAEVGAGVVLTSDDHFGVYGEAQVREGMFEEISGDVKITLVKGGVEAFSGPTISAGIELGAEFVGSIEVLGDDSGNLLGITLGLGAGEEIGVFFSHGAGWAVQLLAERTIPMRIANTYAMATEMQPIQLPRAKKITGWQKALIRGAIDALVATGAPPMSTVLPLLIELVNSRGFSVGIGLGGDAGLLGGAGLGFGVILAPNDDVGVFGEVEVSAGILAGISAGARIIAIRGSIDVFNETSYAVGITLEEEASVSAIALFNAQKQFHGVSFQLGVGAALSPIQIFTSIEKSLSAAVTQSLAAVGRAKAVSVPLQATQPASTTSGFGVADDARRNLNCIQRETEQGRPISFVVRYLMREMSLAETTAISNAGLQIVSCYESNPADPPITLYTRAKGQQDARRAIAKAQEVGQPAGTPIYFAIDQDPADQRQIILDYFQGVQEGSAQYYADMQAQGTPGATYEIGVYGSGCVLDWCKEQGIATWFWQSFAPGWCGNSRVWPGANIRTWALQSKDPLPCQRGTHGETFDRLEGWGNEGGWTVTAAAQNQPISFSLPAPPPTRTYAQGQGAKRFPRVIENTAVDTVTGGQGNVTWELDQFSGTKAGSLAPAEPLQSAETIHLANWPYCDDAKGTRSCAWFTIDWKFGGGALGEVHITPSGTQQGANPLHIEARIEEGKNRDAFTASLVVRFTYHFSTDGPEVVAVTELTLYGDGSIDQKSNWQARAAA